MAPSDQSLPLLEEPTSLTVKYHRRTGWARLLRACTLTHRVRLVSVDSWMHRGVPLAARCRKRPRLELRLSDQTFAVLRCFLSNESFVAGTVRSTRSSGYPPAGNLWTEGNALLACAVLSVR